MRVGQVLVGRDKFVVHVNVEHAVYAGNQIEFGDVLTGPAQGLARHPGGAQGMASMLAILQTYLESALCHVPTPLTGLDNLTLRGRAGSMRLSGISAFWAAMSHGILSIRKWGILIVMVEPQVQHVSRVLRL